MRSSLLALAVGTTIVVTATSFAIQSQNQQGQGQGQSRGQERGGAPFDTQALLRGLQETPGYLGHELAQTASRKQVIFAWFENKASVRAWYKSDTHRSVMKQFFGGNGDREPLPELADDFGPIMAIASITMNANPQFDATTLPISQIAIELYTPVSGGLYLGERFAPEGVKVGNMKDYTPAD